MPSDAQRERDPQDPQPYPVSSSNTEQFGDLLDIVVTQDEQRRAMSGGDGGGGGGGGGGWRGGCITHRRTGSTPALIPHPAGYVTYVFTKIIHRPLF